jgi:hypothetical protein
MGRVEQGGEPCQAYYAAFLRSLGLPGTMAAARGVFRQKGHHCDYLDFIRRAERTAPAAIYDRVYNRVIDKAGWSAHIEARGQKEFHERFPACQTCGDLLCGCADEAWAAAA